MGIIELADLFFSFFFFFFNKWDVLLSIFFDIYIWTVLK